MYEGQQHEGHAGVPDEIPHLEAEQRISTLPKDNVSTLHRDKICIFQTKE